MATLATLALGIETGGLVTGATAFDSAVDRISRGAGEAAGATDKLQSSLTGTVGAIQRVAAAAGIGLGVAGVIALTDAYKSLNAQVKLVSRSAAEYQRVSAQLFDLAQRSRAPLAETAGLYASIARSTREMQLSSEDMLRVTETVNKALVVSGASATAAQGALVQLGQALASGTLRGQELNSVMLNTPRLAQAIAEGMGITVGELRSMGAQGLITAGQVVEALKQQSQTIDAEFAQLPVRVSESFTKLRNAVMQSIGELDSGLGVTSGLATALGTLADHIDLVVRGMVLMGSVWTARTVAPMVIGAAKAVQAQVALFTSIRAGNAVMLGSAQAAAQKAQWQLRNAQLAQVEAGNEVRLATIRANNARVLVQSSIAQGAALNVRRNAMLQLTAATTALTVAQGRLTAATGAATAAQVAATAAARGLGAGALIAARGMAILRAGMAFLGGPVGLAITAVTAGIAFFATRTKKAEESVNELGDETDALNESLKRLQPTFQAAVRDMNRMADEADNLRSVLETQGLKAYEAAQLQRSAHEAAAKAFAESAQNAGDYYEAIARGDPAARQALGAAFRMVSAQDALSKAEDRANKARDRASEARQAALRVVEAEHKLEVARLATSGRTIAAAERERDLSLDRARAALQQEAAEGKLTRAQAARLADLQQSLDTEERALAVRQRSLALAEEVTSAQDALAVALAEQSARTAEVTRLQEELALAERQRARDARVAAGELNPLMSTYLEVLDRATVGVQRLTREEQRRRDEARQLRDAAVGVDVLQLQAAGKVNAAKRLEADYRQEIYETSVRQAVIEGKLSQDAADALIRYARLQRVLQDTLDTAAKGQEKAKALYDNLARGISSAMSDAFQGIIENGLSSFEDFFRKVKDLFLRMLAELAAQAATKKLLDPVAKLLGVSPEGDRVAAGGALDLKNVANADAGQRSPWGGRLAGGAAGALVGGSIGYSSGSPLMGGLSGAATGFAMGGPVGAVIGGVGGIVGGLLGLGNKAKKIQQEYDKINKDFAKSFDELLKNMTGFYNGLQGQARRVEQQVKDAAGEAVKVFRNSPLGNEIKEKLGLNLFQLNKLYETQGLEGIKKLQEGLRRAGANTTDIDLLVERLEELGDAGAEALRRIAEQQRRLSEDLDMRRLEARATGDPAAQAALEARRFQLTQEREYIDAVAEGWDAAQLAALKVVQAEETLTRERERVMELVRRQQELNAELDVRALRATGDDPAAVRLEAAREREKELAEAVAAGIDAVTLARLREIQSLEESRLEQQLADEAAREARERLRTQEDAQLELLQRRAKLSGDEEQLRYTELAAMQLANKRKLESLEELEKEGVVTAEFVQDFAALLRDEFAAAMDDTARATERAAGILRQNIASLNQEADVFGYDLNERVRRLGELYGFAQKSVEEIQGLYTRYTPGQMLSEAQQAQNDAVAEYLRLVRERDAEMAAPVPEPVATTNGAVYTGDVTIQFEIHVTEGELQDTDRLVERLSSRLSKELATRAVLQNSARGRV